MKTPTKKSHRRSIAAPQLPLHTPSEAPFPFFSGPCCTHFIADAKWQRIPELRS
jgi:hypothetical protein